MSVKLLLAYCFGFTIIGAAGVWLVWLFPTWRIIIFPIMTLTMIALGSKGTGKIIYKDNIK